MRRYFRFLLLGPCVALAPAELLAAPVPQIGACTLYQTRAAQLNSNWDCRTEPQAYTISPNSMPPPAIAPEDLAFRAIPACEDGTDTSCTSPEVKCADGTQAAYHFREVVGSDDWLIAVKGGGVCGNWQGEKTGENCWNSYLSGADMREMTTSHAEHGVTVDEFIRNDDAGGILKYDPAAAFKHYNTILVNKCSVDRFMGNATVVDSGVKVHFHGRKILKALIKDLNRSRGAFAHPSYAINMNKFSQADNVVFVGQSGGAGGLIMNAEWLVNRVTTFAPDAQVKFILDARMHPGIEAESHFESPPGDLYDHDLDGDSLLVKDVGSPGKNQWINRNKDAFDKDGEVRILLESWGAASTTSPTYLDKSCLLAHPTEHYWCFDEQHVLTNHFREDYFHHQTLGDGVHLGAKTPVVWDMNNAHDCSNGLVWDDPTGTDCKATLPSFTLEHSERLIYTADQIILYRWKGHENTSSNNVGIYITYKNAHVTVYEDDPYWNNYINDGTNAYNLNDALIQWMAPGGWFCSVDDNTTTHKMVGNCSGWVTQ